MSLLPTLLNPDGFAPDASPPGPPPLPQLAPALFTSPVYTGTGIAAVQFFYSSAQYQSTVILDQGSTLTIGSISGLPQNYPVKLLLEWGTANQEVVILTSAPSGNGPYTFTGVLRGCDGGGQQLIHLPGAQVNHGVSQQDFSNVPPVFNLCNSQFAGGADPSGTNFSDGAMAVALSALGSNPGFIYIPFGSYKFQGSYTFAHPGQGIVTWGPNDSTILYYYGNGTFIHAYDQNFSPSNTSVNVSTGGTFSGFTIDGTNAGPNAIGFFHGDLNNAVMNHSVQNFTGANAIGNLMDAWIGWSNWGSYTFNVNNCTNGIVCQNTSGLNVIGGAQINWTIFHNPNQNAIVWKQGCYFQACNFTNLSISSLGGVTNTGTAMMLGADNSNAGIRKCTLNINMECDAGTGNVGPVSISMGTGAVFDGNVGNIEVFGNGGALYQASSGMDAYRFSFLGWINCNSSGEGALITPPEVGFAGTARGGFIQTGVGTTFAGSGTIYNGGGTFFATTLANGSNTYAWANLVANGAQELLWAVTQPASGGAAQLTITSAIVPPNGLTLSTAPNAVDIIKLWTPDGVHTYACVLGDRYNSIADAEQFVALTSNYTLSNVTTAVPLFNATANGALTVAASTSYFFEAEFDITGLSASAHTISFLFGGTATYTSVKYMADTNTGALGTLVAWSTLISTVATATVITASVTTTTMQGRIRGIVRVNAGGTLIPQIEQNTNSAAAVVASNSWMRLWPVGSNTVADVGSWT